MSVLHALFPVFNVFSWQRYSATSGPGITTTRCWAIFSVSAKMTTLLLGCCVYRDIFRFNKKSCLKRNCIPMWTRPTVTPKRIAVFLKQLRNTLYVRFKRMLILNPYEPSVFQHTVIPAKVSLLEESSLHWKSNYLLLYLINHYTQHVCFIICSQNKAVPVGFGFVI